MTDVGQLLSGLAGLSSGATGPRLLGIGWATVDIQRTIADLAGVDIRPAEPDELLGARAWRTTDRPVALVLLEPSTEGRLAAALARRGEGIAVLYLAADGTARGATRRDGPGCAGAPAASRPALGAVPGAARCAYPQRSEWTIERSSCRPPALSGRVRSVGSTG